jgi:hypothetical protein
MASNVRPTFVFENRPLIVWEDLEDCWLYKLKLARKDCPSASIWELMKQRSDLGEIKGEIKTDPTYVQFKYPEHLPPLEELIPYIIMIESECKDGKMHAQGEFIFLESETIKSYNVFYEQIEMLENGNNLKESFEKFISHFSMGPKFILNGSGTSWGPWNKFGTQCYTLQPSQKQVQE